MPGRDLSGRILGEYILREEIGGGGYGVVYRAEQTLLERDVVVKVLNEECRDEVSRRRFLREAKLASRLHHPYAAHVYASGAEREDGLLWIAMELVRGVPFSAWLNKHGRMPLEQFVPFFECVCEVVDAAHQQGIVHRDVKPSNIMVTEHGNRLLPTLLDFGIAKMITMLAQPTSGASEAPTEDRDSEEAVGSDDADPTRPRALAVPGHVLNRTDSSSSGRRLTPSGACMGSEAYMAPEQWSNAAEVGRAADIYSLGIVAYQALTGDVPFTADSSDEYFRQHRYAVVPPLGFGFPIEVDRVIQTALAKFPGGRQKSVLKLASDLRRALRKSKREQLRSSAQQWDDQGRVGDLLWGPVVLEEVTREIPLEDLGELEHSFVVDGLRQARHVRRFRRLLVVLALSIVVGGFLYRAAKCARQATLEAQLAQEQARRAWEVAEAITKQKELEQGRSALLHHEPDAPIHLACAYQRGDHSPSTAFMLACSLEPRLAEQARLASTSGRMWSAVFSPDGRQIVTTDDRAAQVWDAQTYRRTSVLFHGDTVYHALYSADGARIVTAGGDGTVKIWDAASGELVRELRRDGARLRYFIAALSPDGRLVAAINTQGDVAHVWDAATGAPVAEIHNDGLVFPGLAFSNDGHWLAATGGGDVRVIDTRTWKPALTIRGPRVRSLAFDPTGAHLVTGTTTGDAAIWSVPSGTRIRHLRDAGESIDAVAYSSDGQLVAAGSRDGTVQVWRAESGELNGQFNARHSKVLAVEFDRASRLVLAAGFDGAVVVAEADEGMPLAVLEGPQSVLVAHFDPDARRVVGTSLEGTAQVWDATPPYRRWRSPSLADNCHLAPISTSDSRFIAVGCLHQPTRVWDTSRDQLLAELPSATLVAGDSPSAAPAVSSAGDRVAIARDRVVEVYGLPGGPRLRTIAHSAPVSAVAFAATGRDLVSGATDGSLLVMRDDGAQIVLPAAAGGVDAVGFLPDGRIVAADAQRRLRVFAPGGAALADLEIPTRLASLRIDGTRLVGVPYTTTAVPAPLVDLERYRIVTRLEGQIGQLLSARWVAGSQILTASTSGTAQLWDGSTGQLLQTYRGGSRFLADATLLPDGLVVGGGADGLLRFWDKDNGSLLWTLPAHTSAIYGVHAEGAGIVTRGMTGELAHWRLPDPGKVIQACRDHERCAMVLR